MFISSSVQETELFGRNFAINLRAGQVVALQGELGSGKTHFVKGVVAGIGSDAQVTSPTFTIIHQYGGGRLTVYHFDFFRLEDRQAAERLASEEYFFGDGLCLVEWADRFPELMPQATSRVSFRILSDHERAICLEEAAAQPAPS